MITLEFKPVLTEKTLKLAGYGWYTFATDISARKTQIALSISRLYNVTVTNVRTLHVHGKSRRVGKKMQVKHQPNWKKVLVTLKTGQTIDAFHAVGEEGKK